MTAMIARMIITTATATSIFMSYPLQASGRGDQVFVLRGACSLMRVGPKYLTRYCQGKMVSFTTGNGRVGFIFMIGDEGILQFSGAGSRQRRLPGERASQPIDKVRFTLAETAPEAAASSVGTGRCVYGNPCAGTSKISCRVTSGRGLFLAEFVTDGSAPESGGS
jgi:hypothetical protein